MSYRMQESDLEEKIKYIKEELAEEYSQGYYFFDEYHRGIVAGLETALEYLES